MNFTKPKPIEYGKMKSIVLSVLLLVLLQTVESQVSYTWNGSVSSNWNSASNWTPAGIPGSADNVTVVTASNTCVLVTDKTINNFTLSSGTIDLGSHTLTINGTSSTFPMELCAEWYGYRFWRNDHKLRRRYSYNELYSKYYFCQHCNEEYYFSKRRNLN